MAQPEKLLVTGGEGFIGGRIVNLVGASSYDLKSDEDILDQSAFLKASHGVEGIFHCAAKISVPESIEQPEAYHQTNVVGTTHIIHAAEAENAKVIFSSSAAIYGESSQPVSETDALSPLSPYAENKQDSEQLLANASCPSVILRYFNVYGPGQSAAYAGVITAFIKAALAGDDLVIYGDGSQVRDFVYVDDVARANSAAMSSNFTNAEVFNIASGTGITIRELAEKIVELTGSTSRIVHAPPREGDIVYSVGNATKAHELLGWRTQMSLADGLKETIDSLKN